MARRPGGGGLSSFVSRGRFLRRAVRRGAEGEPGRRRGCMSACFDRGDRSLDRLALSRLDGDRPAWRAATTMRWCSAERVEIAGAAGRAVQADGEACGSVSDPASPWRSGRWTCWCRSTGRRAPRPRPGYTLRTIRAIPAPSRLDGKRRGAMRIGIVGAGGAHGADAGARGCSAPRALSWSARSTCRRARPTVTTRASLARGRPCGCADSGRSGALVRRRGCGCSTFTAPGGDRALRALAAAGQDGARDRHDRGWRAISSRRS